MHREVQARFGGECLETSHSNVKRRRTLSLHRKHGQLEWTPIAIIFGGLLFTLTAPMYIWNVVGI